MGGRWYCALTMGADHREGGTRLTATRPTGFEPPAIGVRSGELEWPPYIVHFAFNHSRAFLNGVEG